MNQTKAIIDKPWHSMNPDEALKVLDSSGGGLLGEQVRARLLEYGPNVLSGRRKTPVIYILLRQFLNPLVYVLLAAAIVKFSFGRFFDGAVILSVLLFMAFVGFFQELRAQKAMDALVNMAAPKARVKRDGGKEQVFSKELVPGDILTLEAGDKVPADARLIESSNLKVNESPFTGESMPVDKAVDAVGEGSSITGRLSMVYMGTVVTYGRATAVVTSTGMDTEIGKIAKAIQEIQPEKTPLQKSIDNLGHYIIGIVSFAAALLVAAGFFRGLGGIEIFMLAVAAAVAAIPEGLPAVVTVVLAMGMHIMARRNAIVRRLVAVETLGSATVICSDKTGTLTLSQMTASRVYCNGEFINISGEGYSPKGEFIKGGSAVNVEESSPLNLLLESGVLCNDSLLSASDEGKGWDILGDPTEGALLALSAKASLKKEDLEKSFPRIDEIPFQSEKQYMATFHQKDGKHRAYVKGSPEKILSWSKYVLREGGLLPLESPDLSAAQRASDAMAADAMRVIALAYIDFDNTKRKLKEDDLSGGLVFLGLVGMIDPPRPEAKEAVKLCKQAGIRVVMITGDNKLTAEAIARQLDFPEGEAIDGRELAGMDEGRLNRCIDDVFVFARIEPLHKLRIVEALKKRGHVVAMTGDGVNDAPALESASIGIAMGLTGTDVAKEASDMILADDNFATIVAAVEEGRAIFHRLRSVIFFLLSTCFGELFILISGVVFIGRAPLVPLQILWINLVTGALIAIPLGLEPKVGNELNQPPRDPRVGLLYPGLIFRIGFFSVLFAFFVGVMFVWLKSFVEAERVISIVFCSVVIFEWLIAFNACSDEVTIFKLGFFRNPWLVKAVGAAFILQLAVVYLPFLRVPFSTVSLSLSDWLIAFVPGFLVFIIEACRKTFFPKLFSSGKFVKRK